MPMLIAFVIWCFLMFYWLAFVGTIWAWLNVILCLLQGQFIRAGFWFAAGGWMLMWWFHDRHPEQDLSFDKFVPWALTWMVIGACFTGAAWIIKGKMAQVQEEQVASEEVPLVTLRVEPEQVEPKRRRRSRKPEYTLVQNADGVYELKE